MALDYLPIEEAERLAGKRLDRRRKYFLFDMNVDESVKSGLIYSGRSLTTA